MDRLYELALTEEEWREVIGWLNNGNFTSGELAKRIAAELNKKLEGAE